MASIALLAGSASVICMLFCGVKNAYAGSFKVQLEVAVCNANLVCEEMIGEDYAHCPSDCEAPPPPPPDPTPAEANTGGMQTGGGYGGFGSWNSVGSTGTAQQQIRIPPVLAPVRRPTQQVQTVIASSSAPTASSSPTGIDGLIRISPFTNHAVLDFKVFFPSLLTISWGKTPSYELGIVGDSEYHKVFSKELSDLEPRTRYYYHLELLDSLRRVTTYDGSFITASSNSKAKFPVIIDFAANPGARTDELEFSWNIGPGIDTIDEMISQLKADEDAATAVSDADKLDAPFVRLTRSEFGFAMDPFDGKVVYEGSGNHAADVGLVDGQRYFYSIFLMDKKGNYSTPAIVFHAHKASLEADAASKLKKGMPYDPLLDDGAVFVVDQGSDSAGNADSYPIDCQKSVTDRTVSANAGVSMRFLQDGTEISADSSEIQADGTKSLLIQVGPDGLSDSDTVSLCLYSYEKERWNQYVLSKTADGGRELLFPKLSSEISGKLHYQFAIGMLKYKGEIENLRKGDITFALPEKDTDPIMKILGFSALGLGLILSLFKWLRALFI